MAIHSVFTLLGMAAVKPWQVMVKIDIKGVFVQTPIQGELTYMKVDEHITMYAVEMFPELEEFVDEGCLYMLMLKAMYGYIQASAL